MSGPKNIVIFSDGTGNSGAKFRGTNVWRLFEALEVNSTSVSADGLEKVNTQTIRNAPDAEKTQDAVSSSKSDNWDQIALYDDGVGTSNFKPLKIIGGAFGWGISGNLERMYRFLIRHYEPGDRIYLFGFSRGAFTVRTLSNILWYCGLPSRNGLTPDGIATAAKRAINVYKRRVQGNRDDGEPKELRKEIADQKGHKDVPIWFIGAWDTVDAVGLPFDEMTEAFSWLMPLRLGEGMHRPDNKNGDQRNEIQQIHEDDLHPLVQHAYHAMAIDDRRYTFHPMLFQERFPVGCCNAGELKPIASGDNPRLRQVWFAGMHSNVGGGYPQDALSLVSLQWMLNRIEQSAQGGEKLRFTNLVEDYQRDADPHGRLYDSRTGTGLFYRYRPRSIEKLHKSYGCHSEPRIHWSVLERIKARVDHYLPSMIPKVYEIEVPEQPAFTSQQQILPSIESLKETTELPEKKKEKKTQIVVAESRYNAQLSAENHLMVGRWQYWLFVIFFLSIIFMGWWGKDKTLRPDNAILPESHSYETAILDLISAISPSFITPGIDSFRNMPGSVTVAFAILFFLWTWSGVIVQNIQSINWDAWNLSFKSNVGLAPVDITAPPFFQDMKESLLKRYLHSSQVASGVGKAIRLILKPIVEFLLWVPKGVHLAAAKLVEVLGARWLDKWIDLFNWVCAPKIVWFIVILFFVVSGFRISWNMRLASQTTNAADVELDTNNNKESKSAAPSKVESKVATEASMDSRTFDFDTKKPMFDSGFNVLKGERYVVKVNIEKSLPWKDGGLPASPTGTLNNSFVHGVSIPIRRSIPHPYFFLMASIGPKNSVLVPIGNGNSFVAKADGRLYFFVNDGPADWIYDNNEGTAEIEIKRF